MIYERLYQQQVRIAGVYRKSLLALARLFVQTGRGALAREVIATLRDADEKVTEIREEPIT